VQQAESSASRICHQPSTRDDGGAQGQEAFVHAGSATGQPANQGRTPVKERILDAGGQALDGDARNIINSRQRGNAEVRTTVGYHPRRGGRYDSGGNARSASKSKDGGAHGREESELRGRWMQVAR
jgi:hypothetical protein